MIEPTVPGTVVLDAEQKAYQLENWDEDGMCWFVAGNWEGIVPWDEIDNPVLLWEPGRQS